jgi:hypothetical protein
MSDFKIEKGVAPIPSRHKDSGRTSYPFGYRLASSAPDHATEDAARIAFSWRETSPEWVDYSAVRTKQDANNRRRARLIAFGLLVLAIGLLVAGAAVFMGRV